MAKHESGWSGIRAEKQMEARAAALKKWQERQKEKAQKLIADVNSLQASSEAATVDKLASHLQPETLPQHAPQYGQSGLVLYKTTDSVPRKPCQALRRLTNIYLESAALATPHVVLTWPGSLRNLSLAHVFATTEYWAQGNKKGLRSGRFPVKSNTFYPLNHLQLSRESIKHWAQELVECTSTPNEKVANRLPEKDPVYFKIGNTPDAHPCVNEVFPHFVRLTGDQGWQDYSEALLEHLLTKVRRRTEKAALREQLVVLGNPKTAPDATFGIGYRLSNAEIKDALKSLKKTGAPNVVMLDVTRNIRISVEGWRQKVIGFLKAFFEEFNEPRTGLIAITDDPHISVMLQEEISKRSKAVLGKEIRAKFSPIACMRHDDGLIVEDASEELSVEPKKFKVLIKDSEASKVVGGLIRVIQGINNTDISRPVQVEVNFLMNLSALPSSFEVLEQWLDERQADARFRDQFLWASHRTNLQQFMQSSIAAEQRANLEKAISGANKLVADYRMGTAIAHSLAHEVEAAAKSSKHIVVVFTRPMLRTLAERFLAAYEYVDAHRFDDFKQRIRLILTSELGGSRDNEWADRYVFVGIDDEALRFLVADNHVPSDSRLLLTYRAGIYMRAALRPLQGIEEFRRFKPRISMLLEQLTELLGADERSILPSDDFVMPSFNFSAASNTTGGDAAEDDPSAWNVELEDGQVLRRGATSFVYVYEPESDRAGEAGFHAVEVKSLAEGSRVFVMSEDLKELLEDYLRKAHVTVSRDKPFESCLRHYHELVMSKLDERYPFLKTSKQIEAIRAHIAEHHPEIRDLPDNIRNWIHLGDSPNTPFEELAPQAPRKYAHFRAFAEALGFDATQIMWYWQSAIHPIRVNRRVDGRYISDIYSKILFDAESAIVHGGLSRKETNILYEKARDNVYSVVSIHKPDENKE